MRPEQPTPLPEAEGGGSAVVVVPVPVVDLVSLVPEGADLAVLVRVDLVRGSQVGPLVEEMLQDEGGARELAALGAHPLQDVDRFLIAGREAASAPDVLAIDHRLSEPQVLDLYGRMSNAPPGTGPEIRAVGRFRVASVPTARMHLVLLSPTLVALAPPEMVPALVERADAPGSDANGTGRRLRALESSAPELAPAAAVRVSAENREGRSDWGREISRLGLPPPEWAAALVALEDGATAFAQAGYGTAFEAQSAEQGVRSMLTQTLHPVTLLLRVMGLARALEASQVSLEGRDLALRTHLQPSELQRVLARLRTSP